MPRKRKNKYHYNNDKEKNKNNDDENNLKNYEKKLNDFSFFERILRADSGYNYNRDKDIYRTRKYSKEQVLTFLESPEKYQKQLREVGNYFFLTSSHYIRLLAYFDSMLTFDHFIIPNVNYNNLSGTAIEKFKRNYNKSIEYIDNYNIKFTLSYITTILLREGVFYGYERKSENSITIQRLNPDYCEISGKIDDVFVIRFNFSFFNGKENLLKYYPEDFKELYEKSKKEKQFWQELDEDKAVCFKFDPVNTFYSIPPFSSVFEDISEIGDYKSLKKIKDELENYKLLLQKIPMKDKAQSDKDFLFTLELVAKFHENIKNVVPQGIGVISTPMEMKEYTFEKTKNEVDLVGQAERRFFNASGTSSTLFNAEDSGANGIERSINVDEAMMFKLLRQFEVFYKKRLRSNVSKTNSFKLSLPDITIYNRSEMLDKAIKTSTYGFPKLFVAACMGMSNSDLVNTLSFENDFLELPDSLIPATSSHVQGNDEGGRPTKSSSKLSDEGEKTRDGDKNKK